MTEVTYYRWRQEFGGLKSDEVKRLKNLEAENARLRRAVSDLTLDKMILAEAAGETTKPSRRRACIDHVRSELRLSERRVCRVLGQHRSTQRRIPTGPDDEERLTADIVELARQYGRYGYRKIAELLRTTAGWVVNDKRVERIWRREGLKVPANRPNAAALAGGRLVPAVARERPNHVWSYDFVEDRTHEGRKYRMLNIIDEFTHECLAIRIDRKLKSVDVIDVLSDLFILRGVPERLRSDDGRSSSPRPCKTGSRLWIETKAAYRARQPLARTAA